MTKFLVVYHAEAEAMAQMATMTPDQAKAGMDAWMSWAESCGSALVDMGMPLANGMSLAPDAVTPSAKQVCGYSIMEAESMDAVQDMLKTHPHFNMPGQCSIEVHEALPLPGM
jgi:hypothetical protein